MIIAIVTGFSFEKPLNNRILDQLLNTTAIFAGFLLTLYGMLGSLNTLRMARLELFRSVKKDLKSYLIQAVFCNIGLHLVILLFYFLQNLGPAVISIGQGTIIFLGILAFTTTYRFVRIFIHLAGGKDIEETS